MNTTDLPVTRLAAEDVEDALADVHRQRGRHLVQHQDLGFCRERAGADR